MMLNSQILERPTAAGTLAEASHTNSATLPASEALILDALRTGQGWAIEAVVRTYGGRPLATARRLAPSENDARESVHAAFLRVLSAPTSYESLAQLCAAWRRVVIAIAIEKAMGSSGSEEPSEPLLPQFTTDGRHAKPQLDDPGFVVRPPDPDRMLALVRSRVDVLPRTYRWVLIMRDIEELSVLDVARLLSMTPAEVELRLHQARQALMALLQAAHVIADEYTPES